MTKEELETLHEKTQQYINDLFDCASILGAVDVLHTMQNFRAELEMKLTGIYSEELGQP